MYKHVCKMKKNARKAKLNTEFLYNSSNYTTSRTGTVTIVLFIVTCYWAQRTTSHVLLYFHTIDSQRPNAFEKHNFDSVT